MLKKVLRRTWRRRGSSRNDNTTQETVITDTPVPQKQSTVAVSELVSDERVPKSTPPQAEVVKPGLRQKQSVSARLQQPEHTSQATRDYATEEIPESELPLDVTLDQPAGSSKALRELRKVSERFRHNYERFLAKHDQFLTLNNEIDSAIQVAEVGTEISYSAAIFKKHISNVLEVNNRKEEYSNTKWPSKVGRLLGALYPVVKITIGITTTVAEVCSFVTCLIS
jgi:hypothetical protein